MAKLPVDWQKEQIPQDLLELRSLVAELPWTWRDKLQPLCDRICHFVRLQDRLIKIAQDSVDQLQLDVKYLTFDLEITRRERDTYQEELKEWEEFGGEFGEAGQ
jgi:hypothetical protein